MKVITSTSEYELTYNGTQFSLEKTVLKPGKYSAVQVGRIFKDKKATIIQGMLFIGDMHTSLLRNEEDLERFIADPIITEPDKVAVTIKLSLEAYEIAQRRVLSGKHRSVPDYLAYNTEFYLTRKHDKTSTQPMCANKRHRPVRFER